MLAYILWHWPFPQVTTEDYESSLGQFHQSLSETTISGFKQSIVFRNRGTPWIGEGERGYADWYFMEGTSAMDFLNEARFRRHGRHPTITRPTLQQGRRVDCISFNRGRRILLANATFRGWLSP